jgi:hypothetical protein
MSLSQISEQALTRVLISAGFQKVTGYWREIDDQDEGGLVAVFEVASAGFTIEEKSRFSLVRHIGSISDSIELIPRYARAISEAGLDARYTLTDGIKSWTEQDEARRGIVNLDHWGTYKKQADFLHCVFVALPDR